MDVSLLVRATRAHFLPASLIPFCIGAAFAFSSGFAINAFRFFAGITGVAAAHLAGNVLNDYFDDRSKADTITLRKSPFFGGSRVIQDGLLGPSGMLRLALAFLAVSFICGAALFFSVRSLFFLFYVIAAGVLIVEYTAPPLRLAYNRWGEADIFLCFGIALTPGAFYLFAGSFSLHSFLVSLPVAFLVLGVILCNEIPDEESDRKAGKKNLIGLVGPERGYMLYGAALLFSFIAVLVNVFYGILPGAAVFSGCFYVIGAGAAYLLKKRRESLEYLNRASMLTIVLHACIGLFMIVILVWK